MKVGENKVEKSLWLDYKVVNEIKCSLESGYSAEGSEKEDYFRHFKGVLTYIGKNNGQGLLKVK